MQEDTYYVDNGQGWDLELKRYACADQRVGGRRPLLLVPGYCMNTFILNFHPTDVSMVAYLAAEGFEVWTANLRGQGGSRRRSRGTGEGGGDGGRYGFREISLVDLPAVFERVLEGTRTGAERIDAIGCSLGATFLFGYLAHHAQDHPLGALVAVGGPLRLGHTHPLVRAAFGSPRLAGLIPFVGTRRMARTFLPLAQRVPALLSMYMNTSHIDLSCIDQLVQTVDDPIPYLNQQIAHWIREGDLRVGGVDVTRAMAEIDVPTLAVVANADGIVPPQNAVSILDHVGSKIRDALWVGDEEVWFAHADLFINDHARERVFAPLADWLRERNAAD